MKHYVISDTHFGHGNIIRYCNRPFKFVEEMDAALIKNWNSIITNNDIIIHLGDVSMFSKEKTADIIRKLNGRKILIKGNHDNWSDEYYRQIGFDFVSKYPIIYKGFFILSHYPMQLSETTPYFNYYGHVHNDEKYHDTATSKCVSVERTGYQPILIYED